MNLILKDFDTKINLDEENVSVLEIYNKKIYYKVVNSLYQLSIGNYDNTIIDFIENESEINLTKNISIVSDYFNIEYNSKGILNKLYDNLNSNIDDNSNNVLQKNINEIMKLYNSYISNIDLDLEYNDTINFIDLCKLLKLKIKSLDSNLLDKILLLIDIEAQLHVNKLLVFNNFKQYFDDKEIEIVYENILAKKVKVLFIENSPKEKFGNEIKYIIDNDFDEYTLK